MDDKIFDLMTQFHNEFKIFRDNTNVRFDKLENRFDKLENRFDKLEGQVTIIEHDHGQKLDALFDGYKQLFEGQQEIKADIKELKDKQDNQEFQIKVIKGGLRQAII